jgi:membrane-associated phospholipid phosphatase
VDSGLRQLIRKPPLPEAEQWATWGPAPAFPNSAALFSCLILMVLARAAGSSVSRKAVRWFCYAACTLLIMFVGASQLYLGLAFLTDMIAGWTAGALLALLCSFRRIEGANVLALPRAESGRETPA